MRIRPIIFTSLSLVVALAALGVVVFLSTPHEAPPALIYLVWCAIFLAGWGLAATVFLALRQSLARALWMGVVPAASLLVALALLRHGLLGKRLLFGIVLATLIGDGVLWWRLRRFGVHD